MSTKKEAEKATSTSTTARSFEDDTQVETRARTRPSLSEQQYSVNRVFDESKENIKRGIDNARREIPRNTQAVNDYQEQHHHAAQEIADSYLDSQRRS